MKDGSTNEPSWNSWNENKTKISEIEIMCDFNLIFQNKIYGSLKRAHKVIQGQWNYWS